MHPAFIIIEPNTPGNDSDQYHVVDAVNYVRFRNGAITSYAFTAHATRELAKAALDRAQG